MANRKKEIDPEKGRRLAEILKDAGISPKELAALLGKPHQNIYDLIHSKRNLTEETAQDIVSALDNYALRRLPSYRWKYLVGYDNYKTIVEEVIAKRREETDNLEQLIFLAIAEMNNIEAWPLNDFLSLNEDSSNLRDTERKYRGSVAINTGNVEVRFSKARLDIFMQKIKDYFVFELEHLNNE